MHASDKSAIWEQLTPDSAEMRRWSADPGDSVCSLMVERWSESLMSVLVSAVVVLWSLSLRNVLRMLLEADEAAFLDSSSRSESINMRKLSRPNDARPQLSIELRPDVSLLDLA